MNDFYVYAWRRPDTDEIFYIGKGRRDRDKRLKTSNPIFMRIIEKLKRNGLESTVERLSGGLCEADAFKLERSEIAKYGRRDSGTGILANMTDGGEGTSGAIVDDDLKERRSAPLRGIPRTDEVKAKLVIANLGKHHSDESRTKMSAARRGVPKTAEHAARIGAANLGRKHSEAIIEKMRLSKANLSADTIEKMRVARRLAPPSSANTSGYKGVSRIKNKWRALIYDDGQRLIGDFSTPEIAARSYDAAAIAAWGVGNCYLNFPLTELDARS